MRNVELLVYRFHKSFLSHKHNIVINIKIVQETLEEETLFCRKIHVDSSWRKCPFVFSGGRLYSSFIRGILKGISEFLKTQWDFGSWRSETPASMDSPYSLFPIPTILWLFSQWCLIHVIVEFVLIRFQLNSHNIRNYNLSFFNMALRLLGVI